MNEYNQVQSSFGTLVIGRKTLDIAALAKKITRKGQKDFEKPVMEAFAETPPGEENDVLLTHAQVCRMFDVTSMTVYTWRKRYGMPVVTLAGGKRPPVRYDEGAVLAWAKLHHKKVMKHDYQEF